MQPIDRRKFLGIVGAGSAAVAATAATAVPGVSLLSKPSSRTIAFHAEAGLPARPWPAYATAVVEGTVNLETASGVVTTRLLAGPPGNQGDIGLPGTARVVRITSASASGSQVRLEGVVEDRSTLAKGESARKQFVLDRSAKKLVTNMSGAEVTLTLA
jgi:hypothetical protein